MENFLTRPMTRREALKKLGFLAGTAALAMLPFPLSACDRERKRLVFFFSGTGNSLYIASQLQGELLSLPQVMQGSKFEFEADEIGFVYPVYFFSIPRNVEEFLYKVKLKADYIFAVQTFGVSPGTSSEYLRHHATKNNIHFDYIRSIQMPDNFLPFFDVDTPENLARGKDAPELIALTVKELAEHKQWIEPVGDGPGPKTRDDFTSSEFLNQKSETLFAINHDKCIQCGICSRICPKGNYEIDDVTYTSGDCLYCLACANACPVKAITILPKEVNPDHRYRNPNVTVKQLIEANYFNKNNIF